MATQAKDLVRIGSCNDTIEAGMIRGFLEDNGVHCFVQGENHRSMLGFFGPYIDINIMVPLEQAERGHELVVLFRSEAEVVDEHLAEQFDDEEEDPRVERAPRRGKKPGRAAAWGLALGFGAGHIYAGAPIAGFLHALIQLFGVAVAMNVPLIGYTIILVFRAIDALAAAMQISGDNRKLDASKALPEARLITDS